MEGCQKTSVHKPRPLTTLFAYHFAFILTARKSPSVFSLEESNNPFCCVLNQLLSSPFSSYHSHNTCTSCMGLQANTDFVLLLILVFEKNILMGE